MEQVKDNQQRLDFLEAALPSLIQQRNEALDQVVKARAEAAMQIAQLQHALTSAEERLKVAEARPVEVE